MADPKVKFVPKADVNQVLVGSIVIDSSGYTTADAGEIQALDEHDAVRRATAADRGGKN